MTKYKRPLKVSTPDGKRIIANVSPCDINVIVNIDYLKEVKKDKPVFAKDGKIRFVCAKAKYKQAIELLTKYLEDLFLKGMADENIYTSIGASINQRGNSEKNKPGKNDSPEGKGDSASVHTGSGRKESTKSTGGKISNTELDKSSDTQIIGEDKEGD